MIIDKHHYLKWSLTLGLRSITLNMIMLVRTYFPKTNIIKNDFFYVYVMHTFLLSNLLYSLPIFFTYSHFICSTSSPSPRKELLVNIDPLNVTHTMHRYPHSFDTRIQAVYRTDEWKIITGNPGNYYHF